MPRLIQIASEQGISRYSRVSLGSVGLLHDAFEIPKHPELGENRSR